MTVSHLPARWRAIGALVMALIAVPQGAPISAQEETWRVADSVTIEADGYAPALSPDGRWVAGLKDLDTRQLCVWKVDTGDERCSEESARVADASIAWSPDSRQVAYSQNGHELDSDVFILDVENMALTNLTEDDVDDLKAAATASQFVIYDRFPVWSADGEEILFLRILNPRDDNGQRTIAVGRVVVDTGQVLRGPELVTDEPLEFVAEALGIVTPPLWLPDGTAVFAIRGGQDITGVYAGDPAGTRLERIASEPEMPAAKTPLLTGTTADGDRLTFYWLWEDIAIGDEFHTYGWIDRESGELTPFAIDPPAGAIVAAPPRFSPDGSAIVYGVTEDEQTHQDSTIIVQDLESGETVEIADGVSLQFWEGLTGIDWTEENQLVVPLDNGDFEVITLERE
jgi:Tol biopolymer transport system component